MMVRSFLRICHIVSALPVQLALLAMLFLPNLARADEPAVTNEINKFLATYTRDLAKRLGQGSHIDFVAPTVADAGARTCPTPLSISARESGQSLNRTTLLVACGNQWSIYVPVELSVSRLVVVATHPIATNSVIAADDVQLSPADVSQLAGPYLTQTEDAIGMEARRTLAAGQPLYSQQLAPPVQVRRGDAVVISAEADVLAVKMTGTALGDGRRGEQIRVKNQTSARVIDARVIGPGQVSVGM